MAQDGPQAVEPAVGDDVDTLAPLTRTVRDIEVAPMPMGRTFKFMRESRPLIGFVAEQLSETDVDDAVFTPRFLYELGAEHGETLNRCIAIAVDRKPEEIDALLGDAWLELVGAVLHCNRSFFFQALQGQVRKLKEDHGKAASQALRDAGIGATPSTPLSEPGTS